MINKENRDGLRIEGFMGTWYVIDEKYFKGEKVYLLESEQWGDETAALIVKATRKVILDDVWNGFNDLDLVG